jgi:hypothetical protein
MRRFGTRFATVVVTLATVTAPALSSDGRAFGGAVPAESCAGGQGRLVQPDSVRRDPAGGAFFTYTVGGATVTATEAPPGMDLAAASDGELERYGLPPRPLDGTVDAWTRAMRRYRSAANDADHGLCVADGLRGARNTVAETTCTGTCGNYAGRWATLGNYTAVSANVVVPSAPVSGNCSYEGHISSWVGIGTERGASGLLQAGTITRLYPGLAVWTYPFYEWYSESGGPAGAPILGAWNASPGDEMYERVTVNTTSRGVNFYVEDVTTGQHLTATVGGIYADYDPDSAGWIVENHTGQNESNVRTGPWNWTNALVTRFSTTTYGGSTQSPAASTGAESWPSSPTFLDVVESSAAWTSTASFPTSWYACR